MKVNVDIAAGPGVTVEHDSEIYMIAEDGRLRLYAYNEDGDEHDLALFPAEIWRFAYVAYEPEVNHIAGEV